MGLLTRFNRGLEAGFRVMLGVLLLTATAMVFGNVVLRYFFNYALTWSDEVIKYAMLWLVFLGSGVAARQGLHISMEVLLTMLSKRGQRLNAVLVNGSCAVLSAVVGYLGWRLAMAVRGLDQVGAASGVPIYLVYLAIPAGCLLMMLGFWEVALRHSRNDVPSQDQAAVAAEKLTLPG